MTGKTKKPYVVGLGEVVFDILPDSRKLGGAPVDFLNFAVKNGAQGYLISAIGADDLGREVVSELKKFSIVPVLSITPYPTGKVLIFNAPNGTYSAHILENAAWDYIPYTNDSERCIKKADGIYFDTLSMRKSYSKETLLDLIDKASPMAFKFFDVNLRQNDCDKSLIEELLKRANILKVNSAELKMLKTLFMFNGNAEEICLRLKSEYELKYLILTNGTKESFIFGDKKSTTVTNDYLPQAFAYGAGNAFAGAFMSAVLKGCTQQEAHNLANEAAVQVCQMKKSIK